MPELTDLEEIVKITLEAWDGWPSPTWLINTIARKHHIAQSTVSDALESLYKQGIVAKVTHKDEIVFRME